MKIIAVVTKPGLLLGRTRNNTSITRATADLEMMLHPHQPLVLVHDRVAKTLVGWPIANFERIEFAPTQEDTKRK